MALALDISGLQAWADAMATILLLELCVLLLLMAALVALLAFGARWLQMHVVPLLNNTVPVARNALQVTDESTERVVRGVAEVYGMRSAVEAAARVLLFGTSTGRSSERVRSETHTSEPITVVRPTQPASSTRAATTSNGTAGPSARQSPPPPPEPRQPGQPYDNMAAHAS